MLQTVMNHLIFYCKLVKFLKNVILSKFKLQANSLPDPYSLYDLAVKSVLVNLFVLSVRHDFWGKVSDMTFGVSVCGILSIYIV